MGTHGGPGITAQGQEEPERETQGDAEETPAGTPEADLFPACVRFEIVASFFMWRWTATVWIICWGLLIGICVFMHFKSMSTTGFTDKVFAVCYGEACSVRLFCTLITFSQLPHVDMWNFFLGGGGDNALSNFYQSVLPEQNCFDISDDSVGVNETRKDVGE